MRLRLFLNASHISREVVLAYNFHGLEAPLCVLAVGWLQGCKPAMDA